MDDEVKRLLLKAQMELDDAAEFEAQHKKAFRTAFDFLHAVFPPRREEQYWQNTLELIRKRISEDPGNVLAKHLMMGVYDYLSEMVKDLPEEKEETTNEGD